MVEVRLLVPLNDNEGKPHAAGEVIDVDVETASEWRGAGKVTLITTEQQREEEAKSGHYSDVTGREDVAPLGAGGAVPGPQADEEEDEPKGRKGKK